MMHNILAFLMFPACVSGVAERPPMGWNSWYAWGKAAGWPTTNESNTKVTADLIVSLGLRDAGYRFLIIDDSWENTQREEDGSLIANPLKFPSGMEHVSAYVRAAGLELGLYTTPGNYTCSGQQGGGEPGSFGHVQQDVELWVGKWQIGYLKNCVCNTTEVLRKHAYSDMKAALTSMTKSVVYECDPFMDRPWATLNSVCNIYAVSDDIADSFEAWTSQVDASYAAGVTKSIRAGSWPSFDYLQIGNGGQSAVEYRSQFAMYAVLPAPMIIGTDLQSISTDALSIYLSEEVIAVNQDEAAVAGVRLWQRQGTLNGAEAWARQLKGQRDGGSSWLYNTDGLSCALLLFNRGAVAQNVTVAWTELAVLGERWSHMKAGIVRDLFARRTLGLVTGSVTAELAPHGSSLLKVSEVQSDAPVHMI